MKKNKGRRGFTVVECVAAILVISIITACGIAIFRSAIDSAKDSWNSYMTDVTIENVLAAFQSSEDFAEFDGERIRGLGLEKLSESELAYQINVDVTQGAQKARLSGDILLPVHFDRVKATEDGMTMTFFSGNDEIITFTYTDADEYAAAKSALVSGGKFTKLNEDLQASLSGITLVGESGGGGSGARRSETVTVPGKEEYFIGYSKTDTAKQFTVTYDKTNKTVTYAPKNGGTPQTCAMNWFEEYLLEQGWYLSPTDYGYNNMAGTNTVNFRVYKIADNQMVTNAKGEVLCYVMTFKYNGSPSSWTADTNSTVVALGYRYEDPKYGSSVAYHYDISDGDTKNYMSWKYYPYISYNAGKDKNLKDHFFQYTTSAPTTSTEYYDVMGTVTGTTITLNDSKVSISTSVQVADDSDASVKKTHAKEYTITPFEKALYEKGYYLYYSPNCYNTESDYLYFYIMSSEGCENASPEQYVKSGDNYLCCRVKGVRTGSGQWHEGNSFSATSIEFGTLTKSATNFNSYSELAASFSEVDPIVESDQLTAENWYFAAYMIDTCVGSELISDDSVVYTSLEDFGKLDYVSIDCVKVSASGSAVKELVFTEYEPKSGSGSDKISYVLAKTGEIALYSESIAKETDTPFFAYTDSVTAAADVAAALSFENKGNNESGYTLYGCTALLQIDSVRMSGKTVSFVRIVGGETFEIIRFDYDNDTYASEDFNAIKLSEGVYHDYYSSFTSSTATPASPYDSGIYELQRNESTGAFAVVHYTDEAAFEAGTGTEIFMASGCKPESVYLTETIEIKTPLSLKDESGMACYYSFVPNDGKYACVIRVQYSYTSDIGVTGTNNEPVEPRIWIWKIPSEYLTDRNKLAGDRISNIYTENNKDYTKRLVISYRKG